MEISNISEGLYSRGELSRRSGIHWQTVYNLLHRGIISPIVNIGGINYYDDSVVDRILEYYRVNGKRGRRRDGSGGR